MASFSLTCTCGEVMSIDAGSRDEAVGMLKGAMTEASIAEHFAAHHRADEPRPSVAQVHAMIEHNLA